MDTVFDLLLVGLTRGVIYALLALGFVVIYKTSLVLNLAQGEIIFLLAVVGYELTAEIGLPFWLAMLIVLIASVFLALLINWLVIRPLLEQPIIATIMAAIAVGLILRGVVRTKWVGGVYNFPPFLGIEPIPLGNILIPRSHIFSLVICTGVIIVLTLFIQRTKQGLAMRGAAEDMQTTRSLGVNVKVILSITWAIACAIGGMGAFALGTITGVSAGIPNLGLSAIPVAILGGLESLKGAVIAGLIMGILETLAVIYLDPLLPAGGGLAGVFPFVVMIFVLIFKPYGLFGLVRIERV
jgi:branched-chain amino acid transport system permease protein